MKLVGHATLVAALLTTQAAAAVDFTVTTTADDGAGSLRQALIDANAEANVGGADRITFAIAGAAPHEISLLSALPPITEAVSIDGYTQTGARANSLVAGVDAVVNVGLVGNQANGADGLVVNAPDVTIRGLSFVRFDGPGIRVNAAGLRTAIAGNWIGLPAVAALTPAGTTVCGNNFGVMVIEAAVTIGGAAPAAKNVIACNINAGIAVIDAADVSIEGNVIGLDVDGTPEGNGDGIRVSAAAGTAIHDNVISGNDGEGVALEDAARATRLTRNFVGLGFDGATAAGNGRTGIQILQATDTVVGTGVDGNVISANGSSGLSVGNAVDGTTIVGNRIGTDASGLLPRGNGNHGISISSNNTSDVRVDANVVAANAASGVRLDEANRVVLVRNRIGVDLDGRAMGNLGHGVFVDDSDESVVGGLAADDANVIANNGGAGIAVAQTGADNQFLRNAIGANGGLGIDLGVDGPTANDALDADDGPNGFQNAPTLTAATRNGDGTLSIAGRYEGAADATFRVELFASPAADPSGFGEGVSFVGTIDVTTDAAGSATFAFDSAAAIALGVFASATATSSAGDTSEFSNAVQSVQGDTGGTVAGTIFDDADQDGQRDVGEGSVPGITVFLDRDDDAFRDPTEPLSISDATGRYTLTVGTDTTAAVTVALPLPSGRRLTSASPRMVTFAGGVATPNPVDFGLGASGGTVTGTVFSDLDGNGVRGNEPGIGDVVVFLDLDDDGTLDAGEPSTTSAAVGAVGEYALSSATDVSAAVRVVAPPSRFLTTPGRVPVALLGGVDIAGVDFGLGADAVAAAVPVPAMRGAAALGAIAMLWLIGFAHARRRQRG